MVDLSSAQFVEWFRQVSPYIHAHHERTFVISFAGDALGSPSFQNLINDIALLSSLEIRLVLVCGTRLQIDQQLAIRNLPTKYADNIRITDEDTLSCVKAACGEVITTIQGLLSRGLTNSPSSDVQISTLTGNFVTARPLGVRNGIDYCYTGEVRRVNGEAIRQRLEEDSIVLIPPVGYSPTGEIFNLLSEDVAAETAIALRASKWICLTEDEGLCDENQNIIEHLTVLEAQEFLQSHTSLNYLLTQQIKEAIHACQNGIKRVHIVPRQRDGSLLQELFSRDGIGTLISTDPYENMRKAQIEDITKLIALIQPLEEAGVLVRRSREKLEMEIEHFIIQERDGMLIACAALYPFPEDNMAEIACFVVHPQYRGEDRGDALLAFLEREAWLKGIRTIFVLTTRTAHWFQERGFNAAELSCLPMARRELYNYRRNSKVFVKTINELHEREM